MSKPISHYGFEIVGDQRIFQHQLISDNTTEQCNRCTTVTQVFDPFYKHWPKSKNGIKSYLDEDNSEFLEIVESGTKQFFIRDLRNEPCTDSFLYKIGPSEVADFLSLLHYKTMNIKLKLGFYVEFQNRMVLFQSKQVTIANHLDLDDYVEEIYAMLLRKINIHLMVHYHLTFLDCEIQTIRIDCERREPMMGVSHIHRRFPLQYRIKLNKANSKHRVPKSDITKGMAKKAYKKHLKRDRRSFSSKLKVNLYKFKICSQTKELYVMPYHLHNMNDIYRTQSFMIMEDVTGEFQTLREIKNVRRFLRFDKEKRPIQCNKCSAQLENKKKYVLHKKIVCGEKIVIKEVDKQSVIKKDMISCPDDPDIHYFSITEDN